MKTHILSQVLVCGLALGLVAASSASAAETKGRVGIGATLSRDISVSYGVSEKGVLEGGIGLSSTSASGMSYTDLTFGASYRHLLVKGDRVDLNAEVGVQYTHLDAADASMFSPMVGLHMLVWIGDHFTVGAQHGIALNITSPSEGDSSTSFGTYAGNITEVSFTFWLDQK